MTADLEATFLDDARALAEGGSGVMLSLTAQLGTQLREGYATARAAARDFPRPDGIRSVVVCGMGGSGVAGDVCRSVLWSGAVIPLVVVKGYQLPAFCGPDTAVLAVSFSGDTEETVAAYGDAVARGCRVVAISAGGRLAALAAADGRPVVRLPPGIPMPRAAVGLLASAPLGVLEGMGLVEPCEEEIERAAAVLDAMAGRLGPDSPSDHNDAKALAAWIGSRTPVIWGSEGLAEAAAVRWKNLVNENAKSPAFFAVLPELDHNEIEGWKAGTGAGYAAVALRHPGEHRRVAPRLAATIDSVAASGLEVREVHAEGEAPLEWLFSLVMLGDFVSSYLAVLRGVDPLPVPSLTALKQRLHR